MSEETALKDWSALRKEKTRDEYTYPMKAGVFGFYDAFRRLEAGLDRRVS